MKDIPLCKLSVGENATVSYIEPCGDIKRRFFEIGFIKGRPVKCIAISSCGDPKAYSLCGSLVAIRNCDSIHIYVRAEEA